MLRKFLLGLVGSMLIAAGIQIPAHAATIQVTNGNDSGSGSLRAALAASNDGDVITFASGVTDVVLTSGKLDVTKAVKITGSASSVVTIERSASAGTNFPVIVITTPTSGTIELDYLDIAKGTEGGVGINSNGTSVVKIKHSTIRDNDRSWGAGIYAVKGSTGPGSLIVDSTTISGNTTNSGNACGFCNGAGGIIEIPTTFVNSTIAYNVSVDNGGGIKVDNNINFYNTTIAHNTAGGLGAGIWVTSFSNWPELTMVNTIVAKNTIGSSAGAAQCNAADNGNTYVIARNENTLIEDASCNFIRPVRTGGTSAATNPMSGDPLLGTFGFNNGINKVFPLLTGSPAIGAGNPTICAGVDVGGVDQQGITRAVACSIGAVELQGAAPINNTPTSQVSSGTSTSATSFTSNKISPKFAKGKSFLSAHTKAKLKTMASLLGANQKLLISTSAGKLSNVSKTHVKNLAQKRADSISSYLISLGLSKDQFKFEINVVRIGAIPTSKLESLLQ